MLQSMVHHPKVLWRTQICTKREWDNVCSEYTCGVYRRDGKIKRQKIRLRILYARFHSALYHFPATKAARECGNMCRISVIRTNEQENNPTRHDDMSARIHGQKYNNAFGGFMHLHRSYVMLLTLCSGYGEILPLPFFCIVLGRCEIICSYVET